ncbi:glycerophosphodiester phosphodiesterase family protein [Halobacteriovorax sp. HLS]|uniref:glycerophosphodiester phosphodiesterase family protein n=1 Tax=Halobacteriovorax sp. HLS TaxID=2234000 RepID=UPI0013E3B8BB|nr:glycerophosphodiester phosphodiesterase family protein [Halobacteriovorax sp. HLS]
MKKLALIILLLSSCSLFAKNLGHRAGGGKGEYFDYLPENSIAALQASLSTIQDRSDFLYLEFDIQETKDGEIVIFHDKYIKRMISYKQNKQELDIIYNEIGASSFQRRFNNIRIAELTFEQLRRLRLTNHPDQQVPTLDEYLETSKDYGLLKPMSVEVKYLQTDVAKLKVINKLEEFNNLYMKNADIIFESEYDLPYLTGFLAWKSKFKKVFGKDPSWCKRIINAGLYGVFKPGSHKNQCN